MHAIDTHDYFRPYRSASRLRCSACRTRILYWDDRAWTSSRTQPVLHPSRVRSRTYCRPPAAGRMSLVRAVAAAVISESERRCWPVASKFSGSSELSLSRREFDGPWRGRRFHAVEQINRRRKLVQRLHRSRMHNPHRLICCPVHRRKVGHRIGGDVAAFAARGAHTTPSSPATGWR